MPRALATLALVAAAAVTAACTSSTSSSTTPVAKPAARCLADEMARLEPLSPDVVCEDEAACRERCELGVAKACYAVAAVDARDPADADAAFRRACELGLAIACTNTAAALWSKSPRAEDRACARRMFEKTCAADEAFGCGMVGRMLAEDGEFIAARGVLEQACDRLKGFPCRVLAALLERREIGEPDPARIKLLLERACEGGDKDGCGEPATADGTFH